MLYCIENNFKHRCNGELVLHVLDMLDITIKSAEQTKTLQLRTSCNQTKPFNETDIDLITQ